MLGTRLLKSLSANQQGNALVLATLVLPIGIGLCGLGLDTIQWTLTQRQLQREADSAALAAAYSKAQGKSYTSAATSALARDELVQLSTPPVIESAPSVGPYKGNNSAVRVALESTNALPFSSFFMSTPPRIVAEATASTVTNGSYCVIALEPTSTAGITLQGNANVSLGCGMATNSRAAQAVTTGGSSYVGATHVSAVGGLRSSVNYASDVVLLPYSVPQKDPFSALPTPSLPTCKSLLNVQPNTIQDISNPAGEICYKGMNLKGTVHFAPGIYYIDGGSLSIGSQAVVTGTDVTFILTSSTADANPASIATADMNGGATLNLAASSSGNYKGVLIYQDRRAPNSNSNTVNGNASSLLQGALYFPSQGVSFSGDSGMDTDCLQIVSRRAIFTGSNSISNVCPSESGAGAFIGTRVYLVG